MNINEYINLAVHNEDFAKMINKSSFSDWVAVALFYAAVHYVNAFLKHKGVVVTRHLDRDEEMKKHRALMNINNHYFALKDLRYNASYFGYSYPVSVLQQAEQKLNYIKRQLRQVLPTIP